MEGRVTERLSCVTRSSSGFDFTASMRRLCTDLCTRLEALRHIDVDRVAIRYCQARKRVAHGLQASLTPLRFEGGQRHRQLRGRTWSIQQLYDAHGQEMLYLLSFYLPRFQDRPFDDKLSTVIHELWHVSPSFDGDLRRHPGRCYAHTHSQKQYDAQMQTLAAEWLALAPPPDLYEFLRLDFRQLAQRHGFIVGQSIPTPKVIHGML
jgi:predicted metallopeptidase